MKKVILFVAVISAFSFASCKKDRTCTCTVTRTDASGSTSYAGEITIKDAKKVDAKKACVDSKETSTDSNGDVEITTTTCKLK